MFVDTICLLHLYFTIGAEGMYILPPTPPSPILLVTSGQIGIKDAKCAETCEKQFCNLCDFYFLRNGLVRNGNQLYPITSWLGRYNQKQSEVWGWCPPNTNNFLNFFFQNIFQKRKKNRPTKIPKMFPFSQNLLKRILIQSRANSNKNSIICSLMVTFFLEF